MNMFTITVGDVKGMFFNFPNNDILYLLALIFTDNFYVRHV